MLHVPGGEAQLAIDTGDVNSRVIAIDQPTTTASATTGAANPYVKPAEVKDDRALDRSPARASKRPAVQR